MGVSPHGAQLLIWTIVFTVVITLVAALRLWAVHLTKKGLKLQDYLVLVAYVCISSYVAYRNS